MCSGVRTTLPPRAGLDPRVLPQLQPMSFVPGAPPRHPALAWLAPRLARDAPIPGGTVRLVGLVVHDPAYDDADTSARAAWIGDGVCPLAVMATHADELARYDVVVSISWHDDGPEPVVVLVNP